ncbi:AI-2E family transporter [Paenibacillus sp. 598K]|uniref:AI-2E family transporter n=1 Tax=Paenibacillus sp. 598K TaxID=1117987 RepID=UPI000FFAE2CF|nr:AI-2E family transporter [Paenibacillus sp. 598K]GBF73863.1 AI-2E family transporter [Paenibacillus sp. 598K]
MEKWMRSKSAAILVFGILGLVAVLLLLQLKPVLIAVYSFVKAVFGPFVLAMIISYVLNPVVGALSDRRVPRGVAVMLIYVVFLAAIAVLLMHMVPLLIRQLDELNNHMPELTLRAQSLYKQMNQLSFLPQGLREGIEQSLIQLERKASAAILDFANNIGAVLDALFIAFIIPFLAFYMLKDLDVFERTVMTYVPRSHRQGVVRMLKEIDEALGSYIRGQVLVCLLVGLLAYLGYWIVGLPYPFLLAGIVAVFNIIPYVGPFFGAAPALIMAATISWKMVLLVLAVNLICQVLEGNVISPQVVGRTLHMHPLFIIFALLVGGEAAGILGMILAVPIFAALKVIVQHVFSYYIRRKTI